MLKKLNIQDIVQLEKEKCRNSCIYFLNKYGVIKHPIRGKIKFELFDYQSKCLESFEKNDYTIILKGRQLGLSTLIAGYIVWLMTMFDDKTILVIATKQDVAKNIVDKVKLLYDSLPRWLQVPNIEYNKLSLVLKNGSSIKAESSSPDAARSVAASLLVIDEAAFIPNAEDIWVSAQQTLSTGGRGIVLSTPNGYGNWFHRMWLGATEQDNGMIPIKLPWHVHPDRDIEWRKKQDKKLGPRKAAQECDADFLTSGVNVLDPIIIKEMEDNMVQEPIEKRYGMQTGVWIWKYPDYAKRYVVVADVSRGDATDFSAAHVIELESNEQVAEYKGKLDTKEFGNLLVNLATEYNNALLVIERENVGWATIQQVIDREYNNLFYSSNDLLVIETQRNYSNKFNRDEQKLKPGFSTTSRNRPLIISKLDEYIRDRGVTIRSSRTIGELYVFIWKNGKAQAMEGYNDDLVMSLGIGLWVRDTALRLNQENEDFTLNMLKHLKKSDGAPIYNNRIQNPNKVVYASEQIVPDEFNWLIQQK